MGYRRGNNWAGNWSGRGPFSHLPPWQRPGWLYGRGACWYFYDTQNKALQPTQPEDEAVLLAQQKALIEAQLKAMQESLKKIQDRLEEIKQ
jgi:hypothetical protein